MGLVSWIYGIRPGFILNVPRDFVVSKSSTILIKVVWSSKTKLNTLTERREDWVMSNVIVWNVPGIRLKCPGDTFEYIKRMHMVLYKMSACRRSIDYSGMLIWVASWTEIIQKHEPCTPCDIVISQKYRSYTPYVMLWFRHIEHRTIGPFNKQRFT